MPVCKGCGGSFDDNFKFCPNCGRSNPVSASHSLNVNLNVSSNDTWDSCEIKLELVKGVSFLGNFFFGHNIPTYRFQAEAIGSEGRYIPFASEPFKQFGPIIFEDKEKKNIMDVLIKRSCKG